MAARLAAALALVAVIALGVWLLGSIVATSTLGAIALSGLWLAACAVAAEVAARRRRTLRRTLRGTLVACVASGLLGFYMTSVRDTVVDEPLVEGVPASRAPAPAIDPLAPQPQPQR